MGSQVEKMAKAKIFGRKIFFGRTDSERSKTYLQTKISISKKFSITTSLLGHKRFSKNESRSSDHFLEPQPTLVHMPALFFEKWSIQHEKMAKSNTLGVVRSSLKIGDSISGGSLANIFFENGVTGRKNGRQKFFAEKLFWSQSIYDGPKRIFT